MYVTIYYIFIQNQIRLFDRLYDINRYINYSELILNYY